MFSPKFIKAVKIQSLASFWTTIFMALLVAANFALRIVDEYHLTKNSTPDWLWWALCACAAAVIVVLVWETVLKVKTRRTCYDAVAKAFGRAANVEVHDPSVAFSLDTDGKSLLYTCFNDVPFALFDLGELSESTAICGYVADGVSLYLCDECVRLAEKKKIEKATITYRLGRKPKTRIIVSSGQPTVRKGYFYKQQNKGA